MQTRTNCIPAPQLRDLAIVCDTHQTSAPRPHLVIPSPTCSPLTLCAASRLWTKPISVRYFIPDATPVSISISCITLSCPSCFWGDGRRRETRAEVRRKERRDRGRGNGERARFQTNKINKQRPGRGDTSVTTVQCYAR